MTAKVGMVAGFKMAGVFWLVRWLINGDRSPGFHDNGRFMKNYRRLRVYGGFMTI